MSKLELQREQFELSKIMVVPKTKCCKVVFRVEKASNEGVLEIEMSMKPNIMAHEDLLNKINNLKYYLCKICHIKDEDYSRVNATGLELNGQGEKATFKIHGVNLSDSKQNMPFATHKVHYTGGVYEFEALVTELIDEISDEVFKYLFEGKKAQLTLGLGSEGYEEDEETEEYEEVDEELEEVDNED